jgi:hypothetical protein
MKINSFKSLAGLSLAFAVSLISPNVAQAHHGMDFLTVQSYEIPGSLGAYLFTDFEWERTGGDNEYGVEPGLLLGLMPRAALEVQTRFGKEAGGDWRYQSVTPSLLIQITPPDSKSPFRVAISAGYEFADEQGEAEEDHEEGEHHEEAEEGHGGGGHHGGEGFEGRVIMEYEAGDWLIGTNLIVDTDEEEDAVFGYSAGVRYRVCKGFATGIEAQGEFEGGGAHELIAGFYFEPVHSAVIKIGAGFGLTDDSPDFSLRTGLVWRF